MGGRGAESLEGDIEEKQPRGWGQIQSHIKPPNWISWVMPTSDPETASGAGATLQGGRRHSLLAPSPSPSDKPQAPGVRRPLC